MLIAGAKRLVQHLQDNNIPFALATSSSKENADLKIMNHRDMFDMFSHKIFGTSDPEVEKGKPEPDIFLVCASKFPDKPHPSNVRTVYIYIYIQGIGICHANTAALRGAGK